MDFEFDRLKSSANLRKHGIDLVEAQLLWRDEDLLVVPARTEDESRSLAVGRIGEKHWAAIFTERGAAVRLISVRRARKEEVHLYES